jgi:limonene-1,2-epoxide hydrolase
MREPLETIGAFVAAFVAAWPTKSASALGEFFTADAVYRNGPLPPVSGRAEIVAAIEGLMQIGGQVSVDLFHVVADGDVVMTERVDHLVVDGRAGALPVLGFFEVEGERIRAWRDYFDLGKFDLAPSPGH